MTILYSLVGPFLVWPVEFLFPYPYIVEELFKVFVVWFGPKDYKVYLLGGFLFAFTETVFYTMNTGFSLTRLFATSLLHSLTFLVIYWFASKNKGFIVVGLIFAMLIHFLYNLYIPLY